MRPLAAELGVSPMALYHYVDGKDSLTQLVADEVSTLWSALQLESDGWEASLRRYLLAFWEVFAQYPGLGRYRIEQPMMGMTPARMQSEIHFFEMAGFSSVDARLAWSFTLTYFHGRLSVEARLRRDGTARLDGLHSRDYVTFGIEALIHGLRAMLLRSRDSEEQVASS